ncbi:MAG: hypothetical protein JXR37_09095 [Kiritimatiellae bacterium]|nr:hypothetical protein [Kiritimatiellia bacterium]
MNFHSELRLLIFPNKRLRAEAIRDFLKASGREGVVCFSCGNATQALKDAGIHTVAISEHDELSTKKWWEHSEIVKTWPHLLDATSGHLAAPIMLRVAEAFKAHLGPLDPAVTYVVPTGSGETLVCLKMAYPDIRFLALYNVSPATAWEEKAPLNSLVRAISQRLIR